jgi:D-tyrosyl-tRNA(Tyr) deacylase
MVLNLRLCETDNAESSKLKSILELPGSILIVPQACLGGRIKGKMVQYHTNISKEKGLGFYEKFCNLCKKYAGESREWNAGKDLTIHNGTYGIKQVYSTETNGPFFHLVEF